MIGLLLALTVQQADSGEIARLSHRLQALERINADRFTDPMLRCVRVRADAYRPGKKERGDRDAAARFAHRTLVDCKLADARAALIAEIRERDVAVDPVEAEARADAGLAIVAFVTLMAANKTFQIPSDVPDTPVQVPIPDRK